MNIYRFCWITHSVVDNGSLQNRLKTLFSALVTSGDLQNHADKGEMRSEAKGKVSHSDAVKKKKKVKLTWIRLSWKPLLAAVALLESSVGFSTAWHMTEGRRLRTLSRSLGLLHIQHKFSCDASGVDEGLHESLWWLFYRWFFSNIKWQQCQ